MEYIDILNNILKEDDCEHYSDFRQYYTDNNHLFLLVETWADIEYLNEKIKEKIKELNIELEDDQHNSLHNNYYIDKITEGYWGFTDEYYVCDCCYKIYPYTNAKYEANYVKFDDGDIICPDCIKSDVTKSYMEWLEENPIDRANTILSETVLQSFGYVKIDDNYEFGLYGRMDNPKEIYNKLSHKYNHIIFNINYSSPFEQQFNVWVKE